MQTNTAKEITVHKTTAVGFSEVLFGQPIGKARRRIKKGESFEVHVHADGRLYSEAIDFDILNRQLDHE